MDYENRFAELVINTEIPLMYEGKEIAVIKFGKMKRFDINDNETRFRMSEWRPDLASLKFGVELKSGMGVGLNGYVIFDQYFHSGCGDCKTTADLYKHQFVTGVSKWFRYVLPCGDIDLHSDVDIPTAWSVIGADGRRRKVTSPRQINKMLTEQLPCSAFEFDNLLIAALRKFADEQVVGKLNTFVY